MRVRVIIWIVSQRRWTSHWWLFLWEAGFACITVGVSLGLAPTFARTHVPPAAIWLFLLVVALVAITAHVSLWYLNRMRIRADHCLAVLRKIENQQAEGVYHFLVGIGLSSRIVRRESRILDHLASLTRQRGQRGIIRATLMTRWRYRLADRDLSRKLATVFAADADGARVTGGDAGDSGASGDSGSVSVARKPQVGQDPAPDEQGVFARGTQLAAWANALRDSGWAAGMWRAIGENIAYIRPQPSLFGNGLDSLFNRRKGFQVFQTDGDAGFVMFVIKGPPGAGKSTLALQMCVTLAMQGSLCMYYSLFLRARSCVVSRLN